MLFVTFKVHFKFLSVAHSHRPVNVMLQRLLISTSCVLKCSLFSFSLLPSHQRPTHVKRMMDVVLVHICVSSITTTLRPAPVHTLWSSHPTNNPALVSKNTFLIFHAFSLCYQSDNILCKEQEVFCITYEFLLIDISIYIMLLFSYSHLDLEKVSKEAFAWMTDFLIISPALKRFLLYVRRSEIRGVDIDNPYMNVMTALTVPDIDDVTVVDYDAQEERIYWADIKTQTIKRAFINGTQLETIISAGGCIPDIYSI